MKVADNKPSRVKPFGIGKYSIIIDMEELPLDIQVSLRKLYNDRLKETKSIFICGDIIEKE